jgi:hypothetical protein
MPLWFGLDDTDRRALGVEQIVDLAADHGELSDGDPRTRREVHLVPVLHLPAAAVELAVDLPSRAFVGSHPHHLECRGTIHPAADH